jgi:hypothetical protein
MSDLRAEIRQALLDLVARRDPTVFQNAEVFAQKIKQIGNWHDVPEISVLKAGLTERFPWELQKDPDRLVRPINAHILSQTLVKKHGFSKELALWAVETWGTALGLKVEPAAGNTAKHATQEPPPPPPAQNVTPAPPTALATEPDTSSSRLGVIFATDDSGLVRVYKSWSGDVAANETSGLVASRIKIEQKPAAPLFTAAKKVKNTRPPATAKAAKEATKADEDAPQAQPPRPAIKQSPGEKFLAQANSMLPGGRARTDLKAALRLLQQAVKHGSLKARRRFGEIYLKGIGVKPNLPNAASWFATAAKLGDAESQFQLGSLYQCGVGVEHSFEKAQYWLKQAADQNHKEARKLLSQIC